MSPTDDTEPGSTGAPASGEEASSPTAPAGRPWEEELIDAVPGLARLGVGVAWRTARWTAGAYAKAAARAFQAAASGESATELIEETAAELRHWTREALELAGIESPPGAAEGGAGEGTRPTDQLGRLTGSLARIASAAGAGVPRAGEVVASDPKTLRERGTALIERSLLPETDVRQVHPAYARILELLSPDEGRILRLLAAAGPQPAVDVKTWRPFGIGSERTGTGLSMIAEEAGCRYPESLPGYLTNLFRLGLIWFSREKLRDPTAYQVVEAQPPVQEAVERAGGRALIVRRSIHLTPFGEDFCEVCLPPVEDYMELGITMGGQPLKPPPNED